MTFIDRITKPQWANIILFYCYLRLFGAATHGILYQMSLVSGQEQEYIALWHEPFYFVPAAFYEVAALLAVLKLSGPHGWWKIQQFNLFIGFATFNLVEESFLKPNKYDAAEYEGIFWAFVFILFAYLWKRHKAAKT